MNVCSKSNQIKFTIRPRRFIDRKKDYQLQRNAKKLKHLKKWNYKNLLTNNKACTQCVLLHSELLQFYWYVSYRSNNCLDIDLRAHASWKSTNQLVALSLNVFSDIVFTQCRRVANVFIFYIPIWPRSPAERARQILGMHFWQFLWNVVHFVLWQGRHLTRTRLPIGGSCLNALLHKQTTLNNIALWPNCFSVAQPENKFPREKIGMWHSVAEVGCRRGQVVWKEEVFSWTD